MINTYLKVKTNNLTQRPPTLEDVKSSEKILFALFTRYGDTIIDLVVIKEFVEIYPNKNYLVICPKQMSPYVREILPNIECFSFNKRNPFDFFRVERMLKKRHFDIGFNPWSNGVDGCYFISLCKKYLCNRDFSHPKVINHYQMVRQYLFLEDKPWKMRILKMKESYKKVLICPQSTDPDRSIDALQVKKIILDLGSKVLGSEITIAAMDESYFTQGCFRFRFKKTRKSSSNFLNLVKNSDLLICSDSAPLHLAAALGKDFIAVFKITNPEIVLNIDTKLKIITQ